MVRQHVGIICYLRACSNIILHLGKRGGGGGGGDGLGFCMTSVRKKRRGSCTYVALYFYTFVWEKVKFKTNQVKEWYLLLTYVCVCTHILNQCVFFFFLVRQMVSPLFRTKVSVCCRSSRLP